MKHQQGETPQRTVTCVPKSMGQAMLPCGHEDSGARKPNVNRVMTIAGLLQSQAVDMETNSFEEDKQQNNSVEICDDSLSSVGQSVKRMSSEDVNHDSALSTDDISNRPLKRRRKLITFYSQGKDEDREDTSIIEESRDREKCTEVITTPGSAISQDVSTSGPTKNKPVLTSTPNDTGYNNDIDDSLEEDTVVPSTVYHYKRQRVLRREPAGAHMTITGSDGTRVYLRMNNESKKQDKYERPRRYQLLSVPFYQLRHEVESKVCTVFTHIYV